MFAISTVAFIDSTGYFLFPAANRTCLRCVGFVHFFNVNILSSEFVFQRIQV